MPRGGASWVADLLPGRAIDAALLEDLESRLLSADVGVEATEAILSGLHRQVSRDELKDADALVAALRKSLLEALAPVERPLAVDRTRKPFVILVVGVNGSGKTTTIGKLARRLQGRAGETDGEVRAALADLRDQVDALRGTLEETQERLDFAERMLSQGRPLDQLPER